MPKPALGFKTHQDINQPHPVYGFHRKLFLQVRSGLSNRLRTLLSAKWLAERFGRELYVVWKPDKACGARWRDLFEDPLNEVEELSEGTRVMDGSDLPALQRALASSRNTIGVVDIRALVSEPYLHHVGEALDGLTPTTQVRRRVDSLVGDFDSKVMGVHVRRVDFSRYLWGRGVAVPGLDQYYEHLDAWPGRFYLATDGGLEVEQEFGNRYGDRVITQTKHASGRDSPEAIQEALVDLLVLRKCAGLIGTKYSSFTNLARRFDAPCTRLVKPLPWTAVPTDLSVRIASHYRHCLRLLSSSQ
jgi:hypothetical protein